MPRLRQRPIMHGPNLRRRGDGAVPIECTYVVMILESSLSTTLQPGATQTVTAADFDDGSFPVPSYWMIELLGGGGETLDSDEGVDPNTISVTVGCDQIPSCTIRITGWDKDLTTYPEYRECAASDTSTLFVSDPNFFCP